MPVPPPATDQQIADAITRDGLHWNTNTITYSLNDFSSGGNALDATFIGWVNAAIELVEEILDIDFQLVGSGGNITFNGTSGNGTYAQTGYSLPSHSINWSNIYFDQSWDTNQSANLDYGSYGFTTIIHEFLHALGLHHPGEYNGSADYLVDAEFEQDTHRYSVMSYFRAHEDNSGAVHFSESGGNYFFAYPQTPMVYDILALSEGSFDGKFGGYNLNTATRNGETIYGYNATGGINDVFNFAVNDAPIVTIYDAGGIDTLDLSGDTETATFEVIYNANGTVNDFVLQTRTDSVIDLREGQYSSTHGMKDNIGIAFGTEIENAIGTQFNDTIYGNDLANFLDGGAGSDSFFAGLGDDTIVYDAGDNWSNIDAGGGFDTLLFEMVWTAVDLLAYGFEQSALHVLDTASELWDYYYEYFNPNHEMTEKHTTYDDGTSLVTVYDVNDEYAWTEWNRSYDENGDLVDEEYVGGVVADFTLTLDQTETGKYGNHFDGAMDEDGQVFASFEGTSQDLILTLSGYDIDKVDEVEVLLNGNSLGYLDTIGNNISNDFQFLIAAEDQNAGTNTLAFVQTYDPIYRWGVSDVELDYFLN